VNREARGQWLVQERAGAIAMADLVRAMGPAAASGLSPSQPRDRVPAPTTQAALTAVLGRFRSATIAATLSVG
jgi:hypothetical protein